MFCDVRTSKHVLYLKFIFILAVFWELTLTHTVMFSCVKKFIWNWNLWSAMKFDRLLGGKKTFTLYCTCGSFYQLAGQWVLIFEGGSPSSILRDAWFEHVDLASNSALPFESIVLFCSQWSQGQNKINSTRGGISYYNTEKPLSKCFFYCSNNLFYK